MKQFLSLVVFLGLFVPILITAQSILPVDPPKEPGLRLSDKSKALLVSANNRISTYNNSFSVRTTFPQLGFKWHKTRRFQHRADGSFGAGLSSSNSGSTNGFFQARAGYEWQWFIRKNTNSIVQPYLGAGANVSFQTGRQVTPFGPEAFASLSIQPKIVPGIEINLSKKLFFDFALPLTPLSISKTSTRSPIDADWNVAEFINFRAGIGVRF